MADSRISLKIFIMRPINLNFRAEKYGMSTDSSMTWLPIWSSQKVDMFGPVKITTVMFKAIA
jgi:hypothetical protein